MKLKDWFLEFSGLRQRRIIEGMRLLNDTLRNSPAHNHYWICGGVLLGWARDGALINHDTDVDFHYWHEDVDKLNAGFDLLIDAGFEPLCRWKNTAGEITEDILSYKGIKFEFFSARKVNGNTQCTLYVGKIRAGIPPMELLCETPGCELEEFEFCGRTWLKPANHEAYLDRQYGNWKVPDRNFDNPPVISQKLLPGRVPW